MSLFKLFERGELDLDRLNYAIITLIPKESEAKHLKKFRLISLINCSFKIFAKAMNNKLIKIADMLISSNQTAFIKGRYILEKCGRCPLLTLLSAPIYIPQAHGIV